jgi:hypothetical protein
VRADAAEEVARTRLVRAHRRRRPL